MRLITATLIVAALSSVPPAAAEEGFTRKDRDLLIELRVKMEEIDKRFEQIDKRFEQTDLRMSDLREDMNRGFEQLRVFLLRWNRPL